MIESALLNLTEYCLLAAKTNFWLDPTSYWAIVRVILGLGLVIFIHELGHFLVAKACGVKCDKFYVGFDAFDIKFGDRVIIPRSLMKWQWGETEYGIGILPLGGYVKMLGQDDNPANYQTELERSGQTNPQSSAEESEMASAGLIDRSKLDPRSFLAKPVSYRMAIISAGVIFNLVSAIFFSAIAFKSGVDFIPAKIGSVVGGGPAWEQNLAGVEVKKIGERSTEEYFTWVDLAEQFVLNTDEKPLPIEFVPHGQTEIKRSEVTPQVGLIRDFSDLAMAGVAFRLKPQIGDFDPLVSTGVKPPLAAGDKIIEVNGIPIGSDIDLRSTLIRLANQEVEFVVQRELKTENGETPAEQTLRVTVQPNPVRSLGFGLHWLPIAKIQQGSPAEKAGLKAGDEIVKINDQDRGSVTNLNERLLNLVHSGKSIELEILRNGNTEKITVDPAYYLLPSTIGNNQPKAIDTLGIAIPTTMNVSYIQPGGPAEKSGLSLNDEIVSVKFLLTEAQRKIERYSGLRKDAISLAKEKTSWAEIEQNLQMLDIGTEVELIVRRNEANVALRMKTQAAEGIYQDIRGISLEILEDHYVSEGWSNAFYYGWNQLGRDLKRVLATLEKLIRGKISPKNLGGPGTIAMVATSEASQGNSRLLLFLAFLSANLAIVNLLPIPVLDGGHLMFLAYEAIFRRPVNEKTQIILTYAGLAMVLSLMVFVVALDIGRISRILM